MAGTVVVERTARIRATPEQLLPLISRLPEVHETANGAVIAHDESNGPAPDPVN